MRTAGFYSLPAHLWRVGKCSIRQPLSSKNDAERCSLHSETRRPGVQTHTHFDRWRHEMCGVDTHEWRYLGMSSVRWNYESGQSVAEQIGEVQMNLRALGRCEARQTLTA